MKKRPVRAAQTLLDAQRVWVKFKDAACLFYASGDFGREGGGISIWCVQSGDYCSTD
jgi:uncharacterized protein YecT (DUF1311 family)